MTTPPSQRSWFSKLKAAARAFEVFAPLKKKVWLATGQAALSGVLEVFAIISLMPLLKNLSSLPDEKGDTSTFFGIELPPLSWQEEFLLSIATFLVVGILSTFMRYRSQNNMATLEFEIVTYVLKRTTDSLLHCSWLTYQKLKAGETYKAMLLEAHRIGLGSRRFLGALAEAVVVVVMTVACACISWQMTLWTLAFASLGTIGFLLCGVNVQRRSSRLAEVEGKIAEVISDAFNNFKTIRLSGRKNRIAELFMERFSMFERQAAGVQRVQNLIRFLAESGALLFIVLFISVGALVLTIDFASLLIFLAIFYRIIPRVINTNSAFIAAGVELRLFDSWRNRLRITEADFASESSPSPPLPLVHALELKGVSFRHANAETETLEGISVHIPRGSFVGMVGSSGSGKTTLVDIMAGLFEPTAGEILVDGVPLRDSSSRDWQSRLGIVEQSTTLFFGTLQDNIAWGSASIDHDRLKKVIRLAHLEQLVERLPGKYEAIVGKGGIMLSGGEIQRIALARALYREPQLLLLDEATSALDLEAENKVLEAIESVRGTCTIIMVSHRLQTVRKCDFILVFEKGKIIERGTWEELTSNEQSYFSKLVQFQEIT